MLTPEQREHNEQLINTLEKETGNLCRQHLAESEAAGIDLLIVQALRTFQKQDQLYDIGRKTPGRVVTNARAGYSWHNFGRAYDVAYLQNGKINWLAEAAYDKAGEIGTEVGLEWGGTFKHIGGDLGHFDYHPGLTLAQARVRAGLTE